MPTDKTVSFSTKPFCPKCGREIPTDEIVAEKDRAWCPNCRREMSFVEVADYSLVKAKRKLAYRWTTTMYIDDALGLQGDEGTFGKLFGWAAKSRRVKRAQWTLSGSGVCK